MGTLVGQFEYFLADKHGYVKSMDEVQFMDYMINVNSGDDAYKDFVK